MELVGRGTAGRRTSLQGQHDGRQGRPARQDVPLLQPEPRRVPDPYHKRSNVETTISMIKAKFGDSLRSKTDTAMVNESALPRCSATTSAA